ncbi:MAG TPA: energy transducer TonB [Sphingomicrobium sp.]|nr:energy transducer TonB [Sphingomicrobium sp.]
MTALILLLVAVSPTLDPTIRPPRPLLPQAESMRSIPPVELFNRPVQPRGNLPQYFRADDYPLDAMRYGEQGTVGVIVKINERGNVADCLVEFTSDSSSLDFQTCRILWLRAHFEPARDKSGKPISSALRQRVRWQLPQPDPVPINPWSSRITLTLAKGGVVMSCKQERSGGFKVDEGACGFFSMIPSAFLAPLLARATTDISTVFMDTKFLPGEMKDRMASDPRTELITRKVVRVTIDPAGKVSRCTTLESVGPGSDTATACEGISGASFQMPTTKAGLPTSIEATIVTETRRIR